MPTHNCIRALREKREREHQVISQQLATTSLCDYPPFSERHLISFGKREQVCDANLSRCANGEKYYIQRLCADNDTCRFLSPWARELRMEMSPALNCRWGKCIQHYSESQATAPFERITLVVQVENRERALSAVPRSCRLSTRLCFKGEKVGFAFVVKCGLFR